MENTIFIGKFGNSIFIECRSQIDTIIPVFTYVVVPVEADFKSGIPNNSAIDGSRTWTELIVYGWGNKPVFG